MERDKLLADINIIVRCYSVEVDLLVFVINAIVLL